VLLLQYSGKQLSFLYSSFGHLEIVNSGGFLFRQEGEAREEEERAIESPAARVGEEEEEEEVEEEKEEEKEEEEEEEEALFHSGTITSGDTD
jgi:hypothetical protein